ncbi:hypothetical protein JCM24511_06951 [Saitozyma sp. JCM 24511]|nr:hypothetical protein JCM24511_06951 [Saitozyma sp. JCM 24511]
MAELRPASVQEDETAAGLSTYPPLSQSVSSSAQSSQVALASDVTTYVDGGYGWVITGSACVLCFQYLGILYAWGVIQAELAQNQLGSSLSLSTIGATAAFCLGFGCLPGSWVLTRLGPRNTAAIGVLGVTFGLAGAGFCTHNLGALVVLLGVVFGFSGSLVYLTAYTIPSQFFMKKRGLSTGIASCGAGLGGAVWSLLMQKLITLWGLPWTLRFMALSVLLLGLVRIQRIMAGKQADDTKPTSLLLRPGYLARRSTLPTAVAEKGMFRSSRYMRIMVACFVASYPFFIPPYGALYSALFNVASAFGRLAFGYLGDAALGNINAWMFSILTIALSSLLIWPNASSQPLIILFVMLCGSGSGGFFSLQSSVVGQVIGDHRIHSGVSWLEVAESFGYFAGPMSAGALLDAFGGVHQGAGPYLPAIIQHESFDLAEGLNHKHAWPESNRSHVFYELRGHFNL